ncbi:hypothetical protein BJV74DRAFT_908586 [Russula compacta]|nr:hypothetical protein BJV74DRAFT_908586 [Russula compacta]
MIAHAGVDIDILSDRERLSRGKFSHGWPGPEITTAAPFRLGPHLESTHRPTISSNNTNNAAVALPIEILHAIFVFCAEESDELDLNPIRWRVAALDFKKLWSTITPDLSPKWIAAFLQRSSYAPRHVDIDVGPPPPKKPLKMRRLRTRCSVQRPLTALPSEVIEEILSHASRIESLHLEGNTMDVIRILASLGRSMPSLPSALVCVTNPSIHVSILEMMMNDETLPSFFPRPSSGAVHPDYAIFVVALMPQLEVLRVLTTQRYWLLPSSDEVTMPVNLKNLSLLIVEESSLEISTTFLDYLLVPANIRRHLKLKIDESKFESFLWDKFSVSLRQTIAGLHDPVYGIHFRRVPSSTTVRIWASHASLAEPGFGPLPWPPLDNPFSLEIYGTDRSCLYGLHTSYSVSPFHRLQDFCVSLGGSTVQELFVEYGTEQSCFRRPTIPYRCWRTLLSGLSSLKTLHFGDGAAELMVCASYGASPISPLLTEDDGLARRSCLSGSLQRVVVSRGAFSTRILWKWIHYAFARPAEEDVSQLRTNVLALLSEPRWKSTDINIVEDATESLLIFLLFCKPMGVPVSELSLVRPVWDEPGGLEILQRLLYMVDPDWNVVSEAVSSQTRPLS